MRVLFFVNLDKKNAQQCTLRAIESLTNAGAECFVTRTSASGLLESFPIAEKEEASLFDFIVAVGGDGTIMETAKTAAYVGKPLIGINTGRLGFLSGVEGQEPEKLLRLFNNQFTKHHRMLLEIDVNGQSFTAINDLVVTRPKLTNIMDLSVFCAGKRVIHYRADSVLFSTPTGSTAYALSNGGPITDPDLYFISMSPICPHSLISRPYLFSDKAVLEATPGEGNDAYLLVDGQLVASIESGTRVTIKKSEKELQLLTLDDHAFFEVVKRKFLIEREQEQAP